jgi:hypothetical protein
MNRAPTPLLEQLVRWDNARPSVPGEHWLSFGLGVYLLTRHRNTAVGQLASGALGILLIARALTGRDGALAVLDQYLRRSEDAGFIDVAAPWPYDQRVRISRPRY